MVQYHFDLRKAVRGVAGTGVGVACACMPKPSVGSPLVRNAQVVALVARVGAEVIGDRIRRFRIGMGLSIRDVAARAALSKTSVVRLEQGLACRPATLVQVCEVLGVHLERLEDGETAETGAVHRAGDDRWFDMTDVAAGPLPLTVTRGARTPRVTTQVAVAVDLLKSRLANGRVIPTILEVHAESVARSHPGEEFVYVLSGRLRLRVGANVFDLKTGESACFWSGEPHQYAPIGRGPARVLSIRVDG